MLSKLYILLEIVEEENKTKEIKYHNEENLSYNFK